MTATALSVAKYRNMLAQINERAASEVQNYLVNHNFEVDEAFIDFCHGLTTEFGEAVGALACQMYDEMAEYWKATTNSKRWIKPAEPAAVPTRSDVENSVYGTMKTSTKQIPGAVQRLVKRTAEDTTLKNAIRDGAEFAWIPSGGSCAFCFALASRGWQKASDAAMSGGHAEHIHPNCNCTYTIRFDSKTEIQGYDPAAMKKVWKDLPGKKSTDKMRSLRQVLANDEKIGKYETTVD